MNQNKDKATKSENGVTNGIVKELKLLELGESITVLDLSHRKLATLEEKLKLMPNLIKLNLSHNSFKSIPSCVTELENLQTLDVSYNSIINFNEIPNFHNNIIELNMSNNRLRGPPKWIWTVTPLKLSHLDLSGNINLTEVFSDEPDYYQQFLQCTTLLTSIKLHNCRIRTHTGLFLLHTFPKAELLQLGTTEMSPYACNHLEHIPHVGIDHCCDIKRLTLSNTHLYCIETTIDIYKDLVEIDLSENHISCLPNSFCNLQNLEICVLSCNNIIYLPDDLPKLTKLTCLKIESNKLCMLSENIHKMKNLKLLDLYDNSLYEVPDGINNIAELDFAQNYLEEPEHEEYLEKREKLRLHTAERKSGRKIELNEAESTHSSSTTDDEELMEYLNNHSNTEEPEYNPPSSPEDWDSDEYWNPNCRDPLPLPRSGSGSLWMARVTRLMAEGNFCPADLHVEPIKREPYVFREVKGQFDNDDDEDDC